MVEALNSLYNDFYRGRELQYMFSTVVKRVTGYDGVINNTGDHDIYVVFTPQQSSRPLVIVGGSAVSRTFWIETEYETYSEHERYR